MEIPLFFLCFWGQKYKKKTLFHFCCFSVAKSSKSHPTDSDVGGRTSESGVGRLFAGLQANCPRRCRFQPFRPLFRHRNQVGNRLAEKEEVKVRYRGALPYINNQCRRWRHNKSALSFDAEKEGAGCGASATGWRIGLILRAPCSAAVRAIPRKTTCGGFWYFWPQKYKEKVFSAFRKSA